MAEKNKKKREKNKTHRHQYGPVSPLFYRLMAIR
jgi:hypothetical protein